MRTYLFGYAISNHYFIPHLIIGEYENFESNTYFFVSNSDYTSFAFQLQRL